MNLMGGSGSQGSGGMLLIKEKGFFQLFGEANVMMVKEYPRMSVLVSKESISQESYVRIPIVSLTRWPLHDRCSRNSRRSRGVCNLTTRKFVLPTVFDVFVCHP